jgi:hypothetical protein
MTDNPYLQSPVFRRSIMAAFSAFANSVHASVGVRLASLLFLELWYRNQRPGTTVPIGPAGSTFPAVVSLFSAALMLRDLHPLHPASPGREDAHFFFGRLVGSLAAGASTVTEIVQAAVVRTAYLGYPGDHVADQVR